jgi:hypothetical protein
VLGAVFFAQLESAALTAGSLGQPLIVLVLLFAALRAFTLSRHQLMPVDFDEAPTTTQKLGLNA